MKRNFSLEVIMNPLFGNPFYSGEDQKQIEGNWLHTFMPSFLNEQQPATETMYLNATGEITAYCLS